MNSLFQALWAAQERPALRQKMRHFVRFTFRTGLYLYLFAVFWEATEVTHVKKDSFLSLLGKLRISRELLLTSKKSSVKSNPDKIAHLLAKAWPFLRCSKSSKKAIQKWLFFCAIAHWLYYYVHIWTKLKGNKSTKSREKPFLKWNLQPLKHDNSSISLLETDCNQVAGEFFETCQQCMWNFWHSNWRQNITLKRFTSERAIKILVRMIVFYWVAFYAQGGTYTGCLTVPGTL